MTMLNVKLSALLAFTLATMAIAGPVALTIPISPLDSGVDGFKVDDLNSGGRQGSRKRNEPAAETASQRTLFLIQLLTPSKVEHLNRGGRQPEGSWKRNAVSAAETASPRTLCQLVVYVHSKVDHLNRGGRQCSW
ncbi:hypothetical protein FB451DRAFT_1188734 [Mycena latifolia]|nr:hypothetical protein FB451DRAFT_1188734 [Mycena latifolia]